MDERIGGDGGFAETGDSGEWTGHAARKAGRLRLRLVVGSVVIPIVGIALAWLFRTELAYFFEQGQPVNLGKAEELRDDRLVSNSYVGIEGIVRDMCIRAEVMFGDVKFGFFVGSRAATRIIVQQPKAKDDACVGAEEGRFAGRLLEIDPEGRYSNVVEHYRKHFASAPESGPLFVLQVGQRPAGQWWVVAVLAFVVLAWIVYMWLGLRLGRAGETGLEPAGSET
ncbi:MAG: hypothetical protein D6806_12200 [Deltaproteobacteria bacterium]|nr:MAG: hypothetical protein D6806_12200 [Deltaproteobacteria bacterium]